MRSTTWKGRTGLQFEILARRSGLRHVFTTRTGPGTGDGNLSLSGGRDRAAALEERSVWSAFLGVDPGDWVVGGQVHGAGLHVAGRADRGRGACDPSGVIPETDGLLTAECGLPLYVAVADCAAVLLLAPGPALAVVHAGWRGLAAGILPKAVEGLAGLSGRPPAEFLAGISPCIGPPGFEVGEEVAELAPESRRFRAGGRWHVDLPGWAADQLEASGLAPAAVETAGLDTMARPDLFFSHRRDGPETGRMGLIAVLA